MPKRGGTVLKRNSSNQLYFPGDPVYRYLASDVLLMTG
jgi:hypothetical protein